MPWRCVSIIWDLDGRESVIKSWYIFLHEFNNHHDSKDKIKQIENRCYTGTSTSPKYIYIYIFFLKLIYIYSAYFHICPIYSPLLPPNLSKSTWGEPPMNSVVARFGRGWRTWWVLSYFHALRPGPPGGPETSKGHPTGWWLFKKSGGKQTHQLREVW